MISGKARVYLAVVAVIVAAAVPVGALSAGASTASPASTAACGSACTSLAVESTGMVLTVTGSNTVGLAAASTTNQGQDFTPEDLGTVNNDAQSGILSSRLLLLDQVDTVVEYQYAPGGIPSGRCLADGYTTVTQSVPGFVVLNAPNTSVTLSTCGVSPATLWLVDANNPNPVNGDTDLINVGYEAPDEYLAPQLSYNPVATPYADPDVLTVNSSGQVVLAQLSEIGGVVSTAQMWGNLTAPGQSALRANIAKSAAAARAARAAGRL